MFDFCGFFFDLSLLFQRKLKIKSSHGSSPLKFLKKIRRSIYVKRIQDFHVHPTTFMHFGTPYLLILTYLSLIFCQKSQTSKLLGRIQVCNSGVPFLFFKGSSEEIGFSFQKSTRGVDSESAFGSMHQRKIQTGNNKNINK